MAYNTRRGERTRSLRSLTASVTLRAIHAGQGDWMPEWIIRNSADLKRKSGKQGPQGSSCKWSSGSLLALTQAVQVSIQVLLLLPAFLNLALDAATTLSLAELPQLTAAAGPTPPMSTKRQQLRMTSRVEVQGKWRNAGWRRSQAIPHGVSTQRSRLVAGH